MIQLLNYEKILTHKDRIVDIHREGEHEFIRFYDFNINTLNFNILNIDWNSNPPTHDLQTTIHYPYRKNDLRNIFERNGFKLEKVYGNIRMEKYNPDQSPNCVFVVRKMMSEIRG